MKEEGKGIVLSVQFEVGLPHGKYTSFYSKGKVKQTGEFSQGLRVGNWFGYFENGKKATDKNYEHGFYMENRKFILIMEF